MKQIEINSGSIFEKKSILYLIVLLGVASAISIGEVHLLQKQGRSPKIEYFIDMADQVWHTGSMPRTAYNPPMVILMILGLRALGISSINPYIFNFCMLAIGLGFMYAMSQLLLANSQYAFWSVLFALLNPYFFWVAFQTKDTSAEFLFLSFVLWLIVYLIQKPEDVLLRKKYLYGFGLLLSAACLSLSRVTGFFVVFTLFLLLIWRFSKEKKRRFFTICAGVFTLFTLLFCLYNYIIAGAFMLATNGGINLYIGNHPAYLHGHPHYDIDVFINWDFRELDNIAHPGSQHHREFSQKAREFILADPVAFVYRVIRKSVWHWFNLEKIPNYSTRSTLHDKTEKLWIAHLDRHMNLMPSVAYLLYKIFYLPVFLLSGIALAYKKIDSRYILLYSPLFGLWPLVVLTFPDTRFKICAEVIVVPALIAALEQLIGIHQAMKKPGIKNFPKT